jgi:hypothetical protein
MNVLLPSSGFKSKPGKKESNQQAANFYHAIGSNIRKMILFTVTSVRNPKT